MTAPVSSGESLRRGSIVLSLIWVGIPLFGKPLAFLSVLLIPAARDVRGKKSATLRAYLLLCCVYALWISGRALLAGPGASEPVLDTLPVVILPLMAWQFLRTPFSIPARLLFPALVLTAFAVGLGCFAELLLTGRPEAQLLLGNPFNLAAVLLLPAALLTFDRIAPGRVWVYAGLAGFMVLAVTMGAFVQTRSLFLGLIVLGSLRAALALTEGPDVKARLWPAARIATALGLAVMLSAVVAQDTQRYASLVQGLTAEDGETEWSLGLRKTMLREGFAAALERPLAGHGPQFRFDAAFPDPEALPKRFSHLHNEFLTHAVAAGLPAVALLVLLIATPAIAGCTANAGLPRAVASLRCQTGLLCSCGLFGVAAVNNLFFVDISAFSTSLTVIWTLVFLESLRIGERHACFE